MDQNRKANPQPSHHQNSKIDVTNYHNLNFHRYSSWAPPSTGHHLLSDCNRNRSQSSSLSNKISPAVDSIWNCDCGMLIHVVARLSDMPPSGCHHGKLVQHSHTTRNHVPTKRQRCVDDSPIWDWFDIDSIGDCCLHPAWNNTAVDD